MHEYEEMIFADEFDWTNMFILYKQEYKQKVTCNENLYRSFK